MLIISTLLKHELHIENFMNSLAYPLEHINEYRYESKYVDENIAKHLKAGDICVYCFLSENENTLQPLRKLKIHAIERIGDFYFFAVKVQEYLKSEPVPLPKDVSNNLVFEYKNLETVETSSSDPDWLRHFESVLSKISNLIQKQMCILFVNIVKTEDSESLKEEAYLNPTPKKTYSIYEPSANQDYTLEIVYFKPRSTESIEFQIDLPSQLGSHSINSFKTNTTCNKISIPINLSQIKDHPVGSIKISPSKSSTEIITPNLVFYYKVNFDYLYSSLALASIAIIALKYLMDITTNSTFDLLLQFLIACFAVNIAFKLKEKISLV